MNIYENKISVLNIGDMCYRYLIDTTTTYAY